MKFDLTVTCTIFSESRERRVVEKCSDQSLSALMICFKKYGVKTKNSACDEYWYSEITDTEEGRKRYEIFVSSDGRKLSAQHFRAINFQVERIDSIPLFLVSL